MTKNSTELAKTLTVGQAIGLAITIVVGSGLLVLPGLAYQQVQGAALYAWIVDALIVIPLLVIFAFLGANFPSAGGIAGFLQAGFSRRAGAATEVLLLGTFSLGIPAIALTGGNYFATAVGGGEKTAIAATLGLLLMAGLVNFLGAKVSGRVQQVLAFTLIGLLVIVAVVALLFGDTTAGTGVPPLAEWTNGLPVMGMVFFAYTGWEMLSFTAEEYRNPKRDFPIAVAASFISVILLYLGIALAVQLTLAPSNEHVTTAPVAALLFSFLGEASGRFVGVLGVVIIAANLIGATWAASRLVFSSAREGLLPKVLSRLDAGTQSPRIALVSVILLFSGVVVLQATKVISLQSLLQVAGQNFFLLYGLSVAAYLKLVPRTSYKVFGVLTLLLVVAVMGTFSWWILYPISLLIIGYTVSGLRNNQSKLEELHQNG
ncbi:APC family permease [Tumebacillus permanentifrigoris]|uniref:Amino acid/polyamine/organocation transporter (APC superfamily) n=1 Tax=Tumebacillus permanentifrigoris TaxID=378543 RepID=A0A316DRJ3_9BACL|nr:amino acid permease [Tumebacillus permanentifrigoris]PWK07439.1 amino acid/polyamine/organocation transporter (APC superfamily) [Tumebacillus permanentifrigoris]